MIVFRHYGIELCLFYWEVYNLTLDFFASRMAYHKRYPKMSCIASNASSF